MIDFSNETLGAVKSLLENVDGLLGVQIRAASCHIPVGVEQDCNSGLVTKEWVDQHGPGIGGDDYHGTVTWKLGDFYLIASYAC